MESMLIALAVVLVIALALAFLTRGDGFPYRLQPGLFTPAERSFLGVLQQAVGEEYAIFGKVRVADVVKVESMSNRSRWARAFNRISGKHVDFVLCDKDTMEIVAAIELNDRSHNSPSRKARDEFLEKVFAAAGLPFIQIPAKRSYVTSGIRVTIKRAIEPTPKPEGGLA